MECYSDFREIISVLYNMDKIGGHYANGNKSDRERQILYDFIYI